MSAIFSPHGGICIRLSVLQSSHRPAPGFRAKSWLKVQSSIEQRESNTIPFPCHLPSCLHCYLWLFMIGLAISASVYAVWLTLYETHPSVHFLKQLTATLRRGVFVRLMNQRCIQQPNRCCSPPVSREMPTVSCTGHLAPWCLSLFIVRRFPITRAGRGHLLSTLSAERCIHNAWRCHAGHTRRIAHLPSRVWGSGSHRGLKKRGVGEMERDSGETLTSGHPALGHRNTWRELRPGSCRCQVWYAMVFKFGELLW